MSTDAQALFEQGIKLGREEKYDEAIHVLERAITLQPDVADYHATLALVYLNLNQNHKTLYHAEKAIDLDRKCSKAYRARGGAKRQQADFSGAIGDYTRAIELEPEGASAYMGRFMSYFETAQYEKALFDRFHYHQLVDLNLKADIMGISDVPTYPLWSQSMKTHFHDRMLRHFQSTERYIGYGHCFLEWGKRSEVRSSTNDYRTDVYTFISSFYGSGYICFTDENIHIVSLGHLSEKYPLYKRGSFWNALRSEFSHQSKELEKQDQLWTLSSHSVAVQSFKNESQTECIDVVTPTTSWQITPLYPGDYQYILTGIRMVADGKFKETVAAQTSPPATATDNVELIKKLNDLKNSGVITKEEFEQKKQEILKRI